MVQRHYPVENISNALNSNSLSGIGSGFSQKTLAREDTQEIIKNSMASKIEHDLKQRYKIFVDRYEVHYFVAITDVIIRGENSKSFFIT